VDAKGTGRRRLLRVWLPILFALALAIPLGVMWWSSLLPAQASAMTMVEPDFGTGPVPAGGHHHDGTSLTTLVADPSRTADVVVELRADAATLDIGGRQVAGFTLNGTSPGPTIRASQGQLIEVRLTNGSVPDGVTLHWHGVTVPNAMDGVAGVTQDALSPGQSFTYRFVAEHAGTYWYHSHQVSHEQVLGGLFGALVIDPAPKADVVDAIALAHTYAGTRTINGAPADLRVEAAAGARVRVRVVNTDNAALSVWSGDPMVLAAVDGNEVTRPAPFQARLVTVAAGGRVDLLVTVPASGAARVQLSKATAVLVGAAGAEPAEPPQPAQSLDLLTYGEPAATGLDPARVDRRFDYVVTQQAGFVKGRPGVWWAINGRLYPNVPMFMVREGELVAMHLENSTSESHPMHLHGHTVLVTARNGVAGTGSPWWTDSFDMAPGDTFDILFRADNPGIWMDHCHNLEHARDGMVAHFAYEGISTPFLLGGALGNEPE
jgi:FtsP/CotA-like multicopper oxidase with cupredoxin domain